MVCITKPPEGERKRGIERRDGRKKAGDADPEPHARVYVCSGVMRARGETERERERSIREQHQRRWTGGCIYTHCGGEYCIGVYVCACGGERERVEEQQQQQQRCGFLNCGGESEFFSARILALQVILCRYTHICAL